MAQTPNISISSLREKRDKRNIYLRAWRKKNQVRVNAQANAYQKVWRKKNPDKYKAYPSKQPENRYTFRLLTKYGLTRHDYDSILQKQDNSCALCKRAFSEGDARPVVDHCHETGKVRGILCNGCNVGLGKLGDTVKSLEKAVIYLKGCDGE